MKKIIILAIFSISLFAQNPRVYSALGDVIYDNSSNIENLKKLEIYDKYSLKIDKYISDVQSTKKQGYLIETGKRPELKKEYLETLRKLSKMNDYFIRSANGNYNTSIKNKDNKLFIGIVNSGLIDTKKNKKSILNYYNANNNDINSSGAIQNMIDEDYVKKTKRKYYYKTKKQLHKSKIERIRESDKYKAEQLEKKLQKELELKKEEIRKEQERELFN